MMHATLTLEVDMIDKCAPAHTLRRYRVICLIRRVDDVG